MGHRLLRDTPDKSAMTSLLTIFPVNLSGPALSAENYWGRWDLDERLGEEARAYIPRYHSFLTIHTASDW